MNYPIHWLLLAFILLNCKNPSEKKAEYTATQSSKNSQTPLAISIQRGEQLYIDFCISCHGGDGKTDNPLYPPLAGSDYLLKNREASIRAVKFGQQGPIVVNGTTYNAVMAPLGLENDEVADVMNYILYSWGNKADKPVSEEEVAAVEK